MKSVDKFLAKLKSIYSRTVIIGDSLGVFLNLGLLGVTSDNETYLS